MMPENLVVFGMSTQLGIRHQVFNSDNRVAWQGQPLPYLRDLTLQSQALKPQPNSQDY